MTVEQGRIGAICLEVPAVINAIRQTPGLEGQTEPIREAILSFASVSIDFSRNPDDENRERLFRAFAHVQDVEGLPAMAIEAALRAHFNLEENLGHQW